MKNIKILKLIIIGLILFSSCSDEFDPTNNEGLNSPEYISFELSVAGPQIVTTREGEENPENKLGKLTFLFFDNNEKLKYHNTIDIEANNNPDVDLIKNRDNTYTCKISSNGNIKEGDKVYVVANADVSLADNVSDINALHLLEDNPLSGYFSMSAIIESLSLSGNNEVDLYRNVTKVSVNESSVTGTELKQVNNTSNKGFLTSYHSKKFDSEKINIIKSVEGEAVYIHPTSSSLKPFIIISAPFGGENYFYRVDLQEDGNYLTLKPNHWYEVEILNIEGKGYKSEEEATKNPASNLVSAAIHDHAPNIFSMVSDGQRELGVRRSIIFDNNEVSSETLFVRIFSTSEEEWQSVKITNNGNSFENIDLKIDKPTDIVSSSLTIDYSEIKSWCEIAIDDEGSVTENDYASESSDETSSKGKVLKFRLILKTSDLKEIKDLSGKIHVYWQGLERDVNVVWKRDFSATSISSVKLIIHKEDESKVEIGDYWKFLSGEGSVNAEKYELTDEAPKLYGVSEYDMPTTKIRNQGFHFPVMYGESEPWWYEYEILLPDVTECSFKFTGDNIVKKGLKIKIGSEEYSLEGNDLENLTLDESKFILYRASSTSDYDYGIGALEIKISDDVSYMFDLYHTGFFHFENTPASRLDNRKEACYYYYEVIKMTGSDGFINYWLDRNLGATASGLYIQGANGESLLNQTQWPYTDGAQGGYYKKDQSVCPPGYRFPERAEWDNIRLSSKFHNEERTTLNNVVYYTSYFNTGDNGEVVFPKSRYINSSGQTMGDPNSGYYWSSTEALGVTESDRWFMALNLNGASSYWVTGDASDYGMSVRCVTKEGGNVESHNNLISFNVTGATHVYLYKYDSQGNMEGVFPWPGKTIGNAASMSVNGSHLGYPEGDNGWFYRNKMAHFSYESTINKDILYVLFNFVTDDGLIWTYSSNDQTESYNPDGAYLDNPKGAKGWKVINGQEAAYLFEFDFGNSGDEPTGKWLSTYHYSPKDGNAFDDANKDFTTSATFANKDLKN